MNSGTVVIGYARKSKAEVGNGHGLDAQETAIRAECDRRGWTLLDVLRDDGASGKDTDRPKLTLALEAIARGDAAGLIVAKLDRLSRSVVDFGMILEWIKDAGAELVSLDSAVDTSTPHGKAHAQMMMTFAELEREMIGIRTKDALAEKRRKGQSISRPAFADSDDGEKLRARVRKWHKQGMSYSKIAARLDARGVPTLRGSKSWSRATVQNLCRTKPRKPAKRKSATLPKL